MIKAEIKGKELHLVVPLTEPHLSASGKTFVIASTNGFQQLDGVQFNKSLVRLNLNVIIPKEK